MKSATIHINNKEFFKELSHFRIGSWMSEDSSAFISHMPSFNINEDQITIDINEICVASFNVIERRTTEKFSLAIPLLFFIYDGPAQKGPIVSDDIYIQQLHQFIDKWT